MGKLIDNTGRSINYLRISVTDRCNLRCRYCMPPDGVEDKYHENILRYEEIEQIVKVGTEMGIDRVRITGGEPLVRLGIIDLVQMLGAIGGLKDISMTTNGVLLADMAEDLKRAGLNRLNISLDSLDREKYRQITSKDKFKAASEGIETALAVGFDPLKINVVVMKGINEDEIMDFVDWSYRKPLHIRFIEFMPLSELMGTDEFYLSLAEVEERIRENRELVPVSIRGNGPAEYYKIPGAAGTIGFISPISHKFCADCNRMRLTADGKLRPCLASNIEVDIRDAEGSITESGIRNKFKLALKKKPVHHNLIKGKGQSHRNMYQIGG